MAKALVLSSALHSLSRLSQNQLAVGTATSKDSTFNTRLSILRTCKSLKLASRCTVESSLFAGDQCLWVIHMMSQGMFNKQKVLHFNATNHKSTSPWKINILPIHIQLPHEEEWFHSRYKKFTSWKLKEFSLSYTCSEFYLALGVCVVGDVGKLSNIWWVDFLIFS